MHGWETHKHVASEITSGTLDGDRLPALSPTKKGAVPATGTPSGLFLRDDGTFAAAGGGGAHALGGASHTADTIANIRTKCSDATLETTAGSAAAASAAVDAHKDLATGVHGAGGSTLATTANIATHASVTALVHGFDGSGKAPPQSHSHPESDVTSLVNDLAAKALASDLSTHAGLTTTAHGGLLPATSFVGLAKITVSASEPGSPSVGDLWVQTV